MRLESSVGMPDVCKATGARSADRPATTSRDAQRSLQKNCAGRLVGRRRVKPKLLAVVNVGCTGCSGSPVCQARCPVDECLLLVSDEREYPFQRVVVDPLKCVGCRQCASRGPEHILLDGCPWNVIFMVPTREWEAAHGELPY